jgi:hypothetical protein
MISPAQYVLVTHAHVSNNLTSPQEATDLELQAHQRVLVTEKTSDDWYVPTQRPNGLRDCLFLFALPVGTQFFLFL